MNVELPWITLLVIALTNAVKNPGVWLVMIGAALVARLFYQRTMADQEKAAKWTRLAGHVPVLGSLIRSAASARYCSALSILTAHGVDLRRALKLAAEATGDPLYKSDSKQIVKRWSTARPSAPT